MVRWGLMTENRSDGPGAEPPWHRGLALLAAAAFFMENLDGTVLVTAVPAIGADFQVPSTDVNITVTAYLVTVAMCIPLCGWLSSRFGDRLVFCTAIAVFTGASALCAISPDLATLTASRILQGIGGAMMVPVGRLVVLRTTAKKDLLKAIAFLTWPALLAPVLAPLVGGLFTTYLSWHWIFLMNIPLGIAAFYAALRMVPAGRHGEPQRLDWAGFLMCAGAIGALVVGMELAAQAGSGGGSAAAAAAVLAFAALAGAGSVLWMRRTPSPLFDFSTLRVRTFRASNTGGFVYRLAISSAPFLLPLLFQDGFGWDPLRSGLMVAAVFVGNIGIKPATTPLLRWLGFKPVLVLAIGGSALTFVLCAFLPPQTPTAALFLLLVISGAFRSVGFTAYNSIQFADIEPGQMSGANDIASTVSQLGAGLGVAVGALFIRAGMDVSAALETGTGPSDGLLPYRLAFLAMAALFTLCLVSTLRLPAGAGAHVTGAGSKAAAR